MKHKVVMKEAKYELTNRDVVFAISDANKKLGELRISKGNLVWVTNNGRIANYMTWSDFNQIMTRGGLVK
jgi:hypothetical protein